MNNDYQIHDQSATYFLTLQIIEWVDIFTRPIYKKIIIDSFSYCRNNKGLELYAYVIMTNHIHIIARAKNGFSLSNILRDFKKFTSSQMLVEIRSASESRKDWMLKRFEFAANKNKRNSNYQIWTHENHAVELHSLKFIMQKLNYIHQNPVRAGFLVKPEDFVYSSASNFANLPSILEIDPMW